MKPGRMVWRIEIINREDVVDAVGDSVRDDIADLGITGIDQVRFIRLYALDGVLSPEEIELIGDQLLADPVTQDFHCTRDASLAVLSGQWGIEVWYRSGVTDAVGETTLKGVDDLGIHGVVEASTGRGYVITGSIEEAQVKLICRRLLANDIIEEYRYYTSD